MTFLNATDVFEIGENIRHRSVMGIPLKGSFTVLGKKNGELQIRNNKGNPRVVKQADWDEVLAHLSNLRQGIGTISRGTMKTRNSTYVLSIIAIWEQRGHSFIS